MRTFPRILQPVLFLLLLCVSAEAQTPSFQRLGIPPGWINTQAEAVSHDGSVIVGYGETATFKRLALVWRNGVMDTLRPASGGESAARGVSADGSVIVGGIWTSSNFVAFRWTPAGGMQEIPGNRSSAFDVS